MSGGSGCNSRNTLSASDLTRIRRAVTLATGKANVLPGSQTYEDMMEKTSYGLATVIFEKEVIKPCCEPTVPSAPTITDGSALGGGQVELLFDPPSDDGGAPITNYQYLVTNASGGTWLYIDSFTANSLILTPEITGVELYFQIRAVNVVGPGAPSTPVYGPITPT